MGIMYICENTTGKGRYHASNKIKHISLVRILETPYIVAERYWN